MTLGTGPINNHEARDGFTLVELLIVCAILGILLAGTIPAFRGSFRGASLRRAAFDVAGTLRQARVLALGEERAWRVTFDKAQGIYWSLGFATPQEMQEATEHEDAVAKRQMPKDVLVAGTTYPTASDRFAVTFYPDGSAEEGEVRLGVAGSDQDAATVRVSGHDGGVTVQGVR